MSVVLAHNHIVFFYPADVTSDFQNKSQKEIAENT